MNQEERKQKSEAILKTRGVPVNAHLPLIESDDEVTLRSADELLHRLIALWAVVGLAFLRDNSHFRNYVTKRKYESWLSEQELKFLLSDARTEREYIQFTWKLECLYFLAWCAGLIGNIEIPENESSVESIMGLFPQDMEEPAVLQSAIKVRTKEEILAWADLLYRLHWAVRDAKLNSKNVPGKLNGGIVQEWHLAVNWMIRYGDEDNWDHVGTDT